MTARTDEMEAKYQQAKRDGTLIPLNKETPLKEYRFWLLVANRFPHDKLCTEHNMIVLKRGSALWNIKTAELLELWREILPSFDNEFDYAKINFAAMRSINNIPHIHICNYKQEYK